MVRYQIELESGGKVTIPEKVLQELKLKEGDKMTVELLYRSNGTAYLFIYPVSQETWDKLFPKEKARVK